MAHGTGALNIAATRVAHGGDVDLSRQQVNFDRMGFGQARSGTSGTATYKPEGRWPSNIVLTHSPDCVPIGTRKVRGSRIDKTAEPTPDARVAYGTMGAARPARGHGDADGTETVEAWECAPGCPVAELDAQSGERPSGSSVKGSEPSTSGGKGIYSEIGRVAFAGHSDTGGASRFFPTFRYEAKADATERPRAGGVAHPTVKPLDLLRWMVRLVTPPGGLVLDPFAGSGTTAEACLIEGFRCITIEREAEYLPLIVHRITRRTDPVANLTAQAERGEDVDLGLFGLLDDLGGVA